MNVNNINIRPKTDIYSFFKRLPYKFEQVIYEFIDNSIDSFYKHREELKKSDKDFKLKINLIWDPQNDKIIIEDNAFGMDYENFQRAFILNVPPKDSSYKSEFGLGLKTAACWLGKRYTVTSTQLGKVDKLSAMLDNETLKITKADELEVNKVKVEVKEHYSKIIVEGLNRPINDSAWSGISKKITDTYCFDIEKFPIEIRKAKKVLNGGKSAFEMDKRYDSLEEVKPLKTIGELKVLCEEDKKWESDFKDQITLNGEEIYFSGCLILFERMKQKEAGTYIYRRGRLIKHYKPEKIFGQEGTPISKRLKMMILINEVPVTFDKSNISISHEEEEKFHELLLEIAKGKNEKKLNFKKKGDGYRQKKTEKLNSLEKSDEGEKNMIEKNDQESRINSEDEHEEFKEENSKLESTKKTLRDKKNENLYFPKIVCREDNSISSWIEIYKLETEDISIEINRDLFIENYGFLKDEKIWIFFKELVKSFFKSLLLLKIDNAFLYLNSELVKNLATSLNEELIKKNFVNEK